MDGLRHVQTLPVRSTIFWNRLIADLREQARDGLVMTLSGRTPNLPGKSINGSKRTVAACYRASNSRRAGD